MSQSLETRAPLLDHKIAEFAWSLPSEMRIDNKGGKRLLREVLYKYVPENLVDRPKQGFGLPVNKWLRNELKDWAMDLLCVDNLPDDGLINGKLVRKYGRSIYLGGVIGILDFGRF